MDAEVQATGDDVTDHGLGRLELLAQREPAVDDQKYIAVSVIDRAVGPPLPVRGHAVHAQLAEAPLPISDQSGDLGHGPGHPVGIHPPGQAADVGQVHNGCQRSAAEIQAVELDLTWAVSQRQAANDRTQQCALPALRPPGHAQVAADAGEVHGQQFPRLLERLVDETDRHDESTVSGPIQRPQARLGIWGQRGQQLVQCRGRVEWGEPHLVRRRALVGELGRYHREHGRLRLVGAWRLGRRRLVDRFGSRSAFRWKRAQDVGHPRALPHPGVRVSSLDDRART
jgi:hypothetical protein